MATKPASSVGKSKRPDSKKRKPTFTAEDGRALKKEKKRKGLTPGHRNSDGGDAQQQKQKLSKDTRIGSRKPVELKPAKVESAPVVAQPEAKKKVELTPEQQQAKWQAELEQIENDPRLNILLDKVELEQPLEEDDQVWMDKKMARYEKLAELLGLNDEEEDGDEEDELLNRFLDSHYNPADLEDEDSSSRH